MGKLIALDISKNALDALAALGLCDVCIAADATKGLDVMGKVLEANSAQPVDLVINCASVPETEMASILSVRQGGTIIFFSMATSFTASALGAEGVGKDVTMVIGNGYVPDHDSLTLELLRGHEGLRKLFAERYV